MRKGAGINGEGSRDKWGREQGEMGKGAGINGEGSGDK
jgi:hypothetical protein